MSHPEYTPGQLRDGSKYPWAAWLSRDRVTLVRGVDFHTSMSGMYQQLRNRAVRHGLRMDIKDHGDRFVITITGRSTTTSPPLPPRPAAVTTSTGTTRHGKKPTANKR